MDRNNPAKSIQLDSGEYLWLSFILSQAPRTIKTTVSIAME